MAKEVSSVRKFWIKLTNWEFWPFSVVYFPVCFYFIWLAIRCRSFFFFTVSNPAIDFGGMSGESKSEIFDLIPDPYIPKYRKFQVNDSKGARAFANGIGYPLVAKPDVGERGNLVEKIKDEAALVSYIERCPIPFLVQEFVDFPVELGLFYVRFPGKSNGRITSIAQKDFLHVIGDGRKTVEELLSNNPRAALQMDFDHPRFQSILALIPKEGEKVIVESIGNHCRGTTFLDKTDQADKKLTRTFDQLADQIDGFYFGRFDLRCKSLDDLRDLKNFKILELNGAGAEPGHIYQPGFPLWKGYRAILWHLNVLAQISKANKKNGHTYWSFKKGMKKLKMIREYNRLIQKFA